MTGTELATQDEFSLVEKRDEAQILAEMEGKVIDEYFYKLNRGGDDQYAISWKGIKISTKDLIKICARVHSKTQFWIFHGSQLAAAEPEIIEKTLSLVRRERFPYKSEWMLSIYLPR